MVFDILSFLAGIAAGGLTGTLAMALHNLEKTADLQERLRRVTQEVARMSDRLSDSTSSETRDIRKAQAEELRRELDEIHEEIRRMYKRSSH
jgi:cob(I)alamin adenosyltransferase